MRIEIRVHLDYRFDRPTDVLLQCEAAALPGQAIEKARIDVTGSEHRAQVAAQDGVGERLWLRAHGRLCVDYAATVAIDRDPIDCRDLAAVPVHRLPAETVQYLLPSRYCPSDQFETLVAAEFGDRTGGDKVIAMRDWVHDRFSYVPGASTSDTTAADSFLRRQGVCRDYAHVLIALVRAAGIPARIASVYALGVEPQDFHAVAEVFLGGAWHLIDATGMARPGAMAVIGIGRDAADVAFLTAFGHAVLDRQTVSVARAD